MSSKNIENSVCEKPAGNQLQLVTFGVGPAILALDISSIQEINRNLKFTKVPHAPSFVRGVTNLRGEVVTIVDLHVVLGMKQAEVSSQSRNLIVKHDDELLGLWVDRIADIMTINTTALSSPPANLQGVPRKLIRGVHQTPESLVMILDLDEFMIACHASESA
ncbi:MAG: chemotaxis protein CheW [Planctomycetales bacterium]|nr:chemotaxis protein CheW [Planctomycetales bacterium]